MRTELSAFERSVISIRVLEELADLGFLMSMKTYFKKKKETITFLSNVLWGFTAKNCNSVCERIFEQPENSSRQ